MRDAAAVSAPPAPQNHPLTDRERELIRRGVDLLRTLKPGFCPRPQQAEMMQVTAESLAVGSKSMIEAPTGVGKTLGYLLPGLVLAVVRQKRLVVSTATTLLQDQIGREDVPLIQKVFLSLGFRLHTQILKGRSRHICPLRLEARNATGGSLFDDVSDNAPFERFTQLLDSGSWDGSRDSLPGKSVPDRIWMQVANTRATCLGDKCSFIQQCPYYTSKRRATDCSLVVTNHDLLLASLSHSPNSVLSKQEENMYVIDEAHHLPDKALEALAARASTSPHEVERIRSIIERAGDLSATVKSKPILRLIEADVRLIHVALAAHLGTQRLHRFPHGKVPPAIKTSIKSLLNHLNSLQSSVLSSIKSAAHDEVKQQAALNTVSALQTRLDKQRQLNAAGTLDGLDIEPAVATTTGPLRKQLHKTHPLQQMRAEIDQVVAAVDDYINAWHQFAEDDSLFPRARWIEPGPGTSGGQIDAVQICSSPFTAGPVLNRDVWPKIDGAVLCSATLAPFGQFDAMARDLGLSVRASTLRLESPFDHSRASIVLPRLKSSPEKTTAHTAEVTTLVRQVMTSADGGVLVIFTSRKQMKDVLAAIGNPWRDQILVQGDAPTDELVRMHVERIDAGLPSTLFGLATMSEGFNLPGRLCTRVVMAKLPFPAPDEPIIAARCEWLAARGQDAFREVMLPKVWVRLAQTAGRLMRSETDWGEVLILDSRMRTKPYGKQLLKTMRLPVQDVTAQTAGEANNRDGHSRDSNERLAGEAREARAATADATARANDRAAPAIAPAARMSPPARRHAVREPARARTSAR